MTSERITQPKIPNLLYKYCRPRLDFFQNPMLRFTPPMEMNDIFDCIPAIALNNPLTLNSITAPYLEKIATEYPECKQMVMKVERILEILQHPEAPSLEEADALFAQDQQETIKQSRPTWIEVLEYFEVGIFCLSTICDSILMWGHYTDSHKGYVLEFKNLDFNQENFARCAIHPVQYINSRQTIKIDNPQYLLQAEDIFLTKSNDWKYESEYRWLRKNIKKNTLEVNNKIGFVKLKPTLISSINAIILGMNAQPDLIAAATKFCTENNIQLKQARPDNYEYKLNIEHCVP